MSEFQRATQAAEIIAALPSTVAAQLLSRLKPADVHRLLVAVGGENREDSNPLSDVVRRFEAELAVTRQTSARCQNSQATLSGSLSDATLSESVGCVVGRPKMSGIYGLAFLEDLDVRTRCCVLHSESASDIAIAMAVLPTETAAETLDGFNPTLRTAVIECMAKAEEFVPEDVVQIRLVLMGNLSRIQAMSRHSSLTLSIARRRLPLDLLGLDSSATSFDVVDKPQSEITKPQPSLLGMDRLAGLTEKDIRAILQRTDTSLWAPALKNASDEIQQHVFKYMASEPAELLRLEIEQLSAVSQFDEENARNQIVASALKLASQGQVMTDGQTRKAAS